MMSDIILKRRIDLQCWRVVGEVAFAKKRPELQPILRRALEMGRTDEGDIAEHLFFEARSRRVVARRMLNIASTLGLLHREDSKFALSERGHEAIEKEKVFVPQQGTWTLYTSNDPLLDSRILRVAEWKEPTAVDETFGKKKHKKRDIQPLPGWIKALKDVPQRPYTGGGQSVQLGVIESKADVIPIKQSELHLEWNVTKGRVLVTGNLDGVAVNSDVTPPSFQHDDVWRVLLEDVGLLTQWDDSSSQSALRVPFLHTSTDERELMLRTLEFKSPRLPDLGIFNTTSVKNVPLRPSTRDDAERWAAWRLNNRVKDYATDRAFDDWMQSAAKPFAEFNVTLPTRSELASAAWAQRDDRPTPKTWHLIAAEDWRLA